MPLFLSNATREASTCLLWIKDESMADVSTDVTPLCLFCFDYKTKCFLFAASLLLSPILMHFLMTLKFIKFFSAFSCRCCCLFKVDERALRDIMEMGFNREAARQALLDNNNNVEVALNFLLAGANQPKAAQMEQSRPPPRGKTFKC